MDLTDEGSNRFLAEPIRRPTIRMNVKKTSSIQYEKCHSSLFDNTLPWIHTMAQLYKDTLKLQCA